MAVKLHCTWSARLSGPLPGTVMRGPFARVTPRGPKLRNEALCGHRATEEPAGPWTRSASATQPQSVSGLFPSCSRCADTPTASMPVLKCVDRHPDRPPPKLVRVIP